MQPLSKDITLYGTNYQIGRFTARIGSWVLMQVVTKLLPAGAGVFDGLPGRTPMSESDFHQLQAHCLAMCRRYENGAPMPVFLYPDTFAIKEMEYDLLTIMGLTLHTLAFNLQPFFDEGGLNMSNLFMTFYSQNFSDSIK